MKAMVLAAGLGTRLRPITYELPKPMVPLLDRPVMAHILGLLERAGVTDVIANLHYFPDTIRDYFGDAITYRYEEELLGTAGGVRNCADFFGDETFIVISGDALSDIDIAAFKKRHDESGGVATLAVKRVDDTSQYGVVLHDDIGRITGFQEKPEPADALSELGNCGIYMFEPRIFDYFPGRPFVDWAHDVFPTLLEQDAPFYVHEIDDYWNDVGSIDELKQASFDAGAGKLDLALPGTEQSEGVFVGSGTDISAADSVNGPVWLGSNVHVGSGARLEGPLVVGDGARIGAGAAVKESVIFPGSRIQDDEIVISGIVSRRGMLDYLAPYKA